MTVYPGTKLNGASVSSLYLLEKMERKTNLCSGEQRANQASTRVLCTSLIFSLKSRDFTCLVAYLDVNSLLKARLVLGQRFKMF